MLPLIIEPAQLQAQLGNPALLIVDLCNEQSYLAGHIPGAVHLLPQQLQTGQPPAVGRLAEKPALEKLFGSIGLHEDRHLVVYDDEGGGWAGRLIWMLDAVGHHKYSYLNGGLLAWKAEGRPLSQQPVTVQPTQPKLYLNHQCSVEIEDILPRLGSDDFVIWDARSPAEFRGEKVFAQRGGHIPGAINCEWTRLMDPQHQLRIRTDAHALLQSLGIDHSKQIVTHCQTHHRSGFTYLVGRSLGLNIRAYHGSWGEWGNRTDTPVEK